MIARLWWKEARRVWPIWAFLAGFGLSVMGLARWFLSPVPPGAFIDHAILLTLVYMFLIGAAVFAGERENRTLGLLDALPVERWRVWVAKATFAAASTAGLGLILWLFALSFGDSPRGDSPGGVALIGFFLLAGLGWGLFWSAIWGNALLAATLGICSLGATYVQMSPKGTIQGDSLTVWHWLFALSLIAASAAVLHLGGPPRRLWFGSRRKPRPAPTEPKPTESHINSQRSGAAWPGSASRLVWQAWRETWPVWWPLAVIGIGSPIALAWYQESNDPSPWLLSAWIVGLVAGANVFNAENRGRTQRFLAHHGARPGVVWLAKLAVGLATVAPIWLASIWLAPSPRTPQGWRLAPPGWGGDGFVGFVLAVGLLGSFLTSAFAAGAWCGMVFRRGITAALVSLIFWLVVCLPPSLMTFVGLVWPMHLLWIPVAILAVTWAWSGDWLLDRPGLGRWARLAAYSIIAAVGLSSAYVANRVWSVPALDPAERDRIFQFDRTAAPIPPEENAADLYRRVGVNSLGHAPTGTDSLEFGAVVYRDWDTNAPEVLDWLNRNEANLEMLRKAAAMPVCRFRDLRKMTVFSIYDSTADFGQFVPTLAVSARVRLAQGDLKGAWTDIESLLRMGRQFSGLNTPTVRFWGSVAESWGLTLAMRWAGDPRQTADSLKAARDARRALPPLPRLADQVRANALIVNNTIKLPKEDLNRALMSGEHERGNASPLVKLAIDAMTTPWEMTRLRRVYDLLAAAQIQCAEHDPTRTVFPRALEEPWGPVTIGESPSATLIPVEELRNLAATTPPIHFMGSILNAAPSTDDNVVSRRALDAVLGLRLQQTQHDGRLPRSLDELVEADPDIGPSLIDPFSDPPARFGYIPSEGQSLHSLGHFDPSPLGARSRRNRTSPTVGCMLLYSVGPDGNDDRALSSLDKRNKGDIVFPLKDDVPPPN